MRRGRGAAAAVAGALVLSACGSTVASSARMTGAATSPLGGSALPAEAPPAVSGSAAAAARPSDAARPGAARTPGTRAPSDVATVPPSAVATSGPGWDATSVSIGVITQNSEHEQFKQAGAKQNDPGQAELQAKAMADDLNARGGVLGRTVRLRFYDVDWEKAQQNPNVVGEAACTYFTQDARVVAVWNVNTQVDQAPAFRDCLAKRKVVLFTAAVRAVTSAELQRLAPYYVHTLMVSWDDLAPVLVRRLQAQGWFGGWDTRLSAPGSAPPKLGILTDSTPQGKHAAQVLTSALAAQGHPGALTFQYTDAAQGQAASVQFFKGNGVTHVLVTDVELTAFQYFAAPQVYFPRYGLTSYNLPFGNLQASGFTPPKANNGAMGVGWGALLDVDAAHEPPASPGAQRCLAVMGKVGQAPSDGRTTRMLAFSACDTFTLIARGAQLGGGFSADRLYRGALAARSTFSPANGFSPALTAAEPYVQGLVRDLAWDESCGCMEYGAGTARL